MTDRANGQLPDGAMVRKGKEPGQAAYEARFEKHPAFMDWSTLGERWKVEWRKVEEAVLAEHSTSALKTLNAEIDRLRQLLARRDSQLAAAGVPLPEIPEGMVPPGALQAYSDAHQKYPPGQDLQAHTAGLRAVLILDRAQRVPSVSVSKEPNKAMELAERLHAWSENDPIEDYFFGGDGAVFSAMQLDCADAAQFIRAAARSRDAQPSGVLLFERGVRFDVVAPAPPAAAMDKSLGRIAYETRFYGYTLGPRGVSDAWEDLPPLAAAIWERVAQAVQAAAPSKVAPLPAFTREMGEAADRYLMSVAFKGDHILPAQFRWFDCWAAMTAAVPKPVPFRLDPRWTGTSLGFEGGCMNLKLPAGSAELVFADDDLEVVEEEGRTLRICRLAASEVIALRFHLNVYLPPAEPAWPKPIMTAAKGV